MGVAYNPKIPYNGLVFYMDAGNRRCFPSNAVRIMYDLSGNGITGSLGTGITVMPPHYLDFNHTSTGKISLNKVWEPLKGLQIPLTIFGIGLENTFGTFDGIYSNYSGITGHKLVSLVRVDSSHLVYYTSISSGGIQHATSTFTWQANYYYFFAATMKGTISSPTCSLYINDTVKESFPFAALSSTPNLTNVPEIGRSNFDTEMWDGQLPVLAIYNRTLSDSELIQAFNAYRGRYLMNTNVI